MHVVNLARGLESRGYRTRLLAGRLGEGEGDMSYYARERGVEVDSIPELGRAVRPWDDVVALVKLYFLFRRERPVIVHTHMSKAGALGRLAAVAAGVPIRIHTFHGHVLGGGYFSAVATAAYHRIEQVLARVTTRLVALSEGQAAELCGALGIAPREKFVVIPLGLELEPFLRQDRDAARRAARRELGLGEGDRVIGIVGRVTAVKGHELLFDAVRLLEAEGLGRGEGGRFARGPAAADSAPASSAARAEGGAAMHVLVVGDGERREAVRRYVEEMGLRSRVHWLGWRRDLPPLYAAMDVLALTSRNEGTPVAVVEALASGTPVVATAVGGVADVLEGGRWGALVPPGDAAALAQALRHALERPPEPAMRQAMQRYAAERYEVERLVGDMAALYEEELGRALRA